MNNSIRAGLNQSNDDQPGNALGRLLQEHAEQASEHAFQPFLADRVMRRITMASPPEEQLFSLLFGLFRPVALASLLLILGLVGYNTVVSRTFDVQPTTTEVVFGLQPVSLTDAFTTDLEPLLTDSP